MFNGVKFLMNDEMDNVLKDRTDFRKRLALIAELRMDNGAHSVNALQYLAENDFVYQVRIAAWQALDEIGVTCKKPVERPAYAILLEKVLERVKRVCRFLSDLYF
jgi:hypothetical protein